MQKSKWLLWEALQIAETRREKKGKWEKERYPSEFRVPKNSKEKFKTNKQTKTLLSDQCKEVE